MHPAYGASHRTVPAWLREWHAKRAAGLVPANNLLFVSLGPSIASRYSTVYVPADYRPHPAHDFAALAAIGVEVVCEFDACCYGRLLTLCQCIARADPYNLMLLVIGKKPLVVVLQQGVRHA